MVKTPAGLHPPAAAAYSQDGDAIFMDIYICVGSSCHLKGSYDIISVFQDCVKKYGLQDKVALKASFCMGCCTDGVAVRIDDRVISGVSRENAEDVFMQNVVNALK